MAAAAWRVGGKEGGREGDSREGSLTLSKERHASLLVPSANPVQSANRLEKQNNSRNKP